MMQERPIGNPAGTILSLLQRRGTLTVKELELALGVTTTAVRQQIGSLLAEGYIAQGMEHNGRGRPRHIYSLTSRGHSLFPKYYDELTHSLLHEILATEGPEKVQVLLTSMGRALAQKYTDQLESQQLAERAHEFSELLKAKGLLVEVEVDGGAILLQEYNCPYYELARQYRAICDMELGMIARVMEQPVELIACTFDGHHGCHFKIETNNDEPKEIELP